MGLRFTTVKLQVNDGVDVNVAVSRLITSLQLIDSAPVLGRAESRNVERRGDNLVEELPRLATVSPTRTSSRPATDRNDPGRCAGSRDVAVDLKDRVKVIVDDKVNCRGVAGRGGCSVAQS